jgi:hypothetical protein
MRRALLVSTAALGLAGVPALAQQQAEPPPQATPPPAAPAAPAAPETGTAPAESTAPPAPVPVPEQAEHQVRAESLLGVDVSNGQDTIGEVADLVVTQDGRVEAVVVGVGGFLGVGQKSVALAWDSIELTERDGARVILVATTREQLEGMPEFTTLEEKQAEEAMRRQQQQMQQQQMQQQPGGAPGLGVAPPAPAPAPGNQ